MIPKNRDYLIDENDQLLEYWQESKMGNTAAFCHLADRLYKTMFNYATTFTNDHELIKDCIQDLLIKIWKKRQTINIQYVKIYFIKALRNQYLQEIRKTETGRFVEIDSSILASDFENILSVMEEKESLIEKTNKIKQAISQLPSRQQEVIFLKFYQGLENDKIADLMQVNRQSVANLIYKAVGNLKSQINSPYLWFWFLYNQNLL